MPEPEFRRLAAFYRYERAPLDARVEATETTADYTREMITFAGVGAERVTAYLYLPLHVPRPLQVLHYVPGGDVNSGFRPLTASMDERMVPFVKAGRAAFGVVLRGYIGGPRHTGAAIDSKAETLRPFLACPAHDALLEEDHVDDDQRAERDPLPAE